MHARGQGLRICVNAGFAAGAVSCGDSIAVNGACLTVASMRTVGLEFDVSPETARRTTLGSLRRGTKVNLERSLQIGQRLHGHFVLGHVDGVVQLRSRTLQSDSERLIWSMPESYIRYLAPKGSVAIAGVSLTVGECDADWFSVYMVPYTAKETTLSSLAVGERANFEIDVLARYVLNTGASDGPAPGTIDEAFLERHGYMSRS